MADPEPAWYVSHITPLFYLTIHVYRAYKSTFQRALEKYVNGLSEKERKKNFIAVCYDPSNPVTPESVSDAIRKVEADHSQKSSTISKVIKKVVSALKDYDGLINSLGQLACSRYSFFQD